MTRARSGETMARMYPIGQIQATGTLPSSSNATGPSGALPFRVPPMARLWFVPDTAGMRVVIGPSGTVATGLLAAPLGAADSLSGPFYPTGGAPSISVVSATGGTVRVFAGPRS